MANMNTNAATLPSAARIDAYTPATVNPTLEETRGDVAMDSAQPPDTTTSPFTSPPAAVNAAPVSAFPPPVPKATAAAEEQQPTPTQVMGKGEAAVQSEPREEWDWQCCEKYWEIFEYSDSEFEGLGLTEEGEGVEDTWSREGVCPTTVQSSKRFFTYLDRIRNNHQFIDGFHVEGKCGLCGWEVYWVKPLIRKGTAPYALYSRMCHYCGHEVEVDNWGEIPKKKDAVCQVTPEILDSIARGEYVWVEGRNTAKYHVPNPAEGECAAGPCVPIL